MSETAARARYDSIFRPGLFAGRVIVVTGGGSGIGRCIAHELASLGGQVVVTGRKVGKLEAVASEIAADGGLCDYLPFDIRDEAAVADGVAAIIARHGRIDGLVNNAGGQFPSEIADISKKGWEAVLAANLTGGWQMMRAVFSASMKASGGVIVNITADMHNGMPGMAHSGAARAGMAPAEPSAGLPPSVRSICRADQASAAFSARKAAKTTSPPSTGRRPSAGAGPARRPCPSIRASRSSVPAASRITTAAAAGSTSSGPAPRLRAAPVASAPAAYTF